MVKLDDIARKVGMAKSTISSVLSNKSYCYVSEKNRKRILNMAEELGYVPNRASRALQGLSSNTIGIIGSLFSVPVFTSLLHSIHDKLHDQGYHILLGDSRSEKERESKLIKEFLSRGVDGLVLNTHHNEKELRQIIPANVAYVLHGSLDNCLASHCIVDLDYGGFIATDHLIAHRHRKIAFVTIQVKSNSEKLKGFRRAFRKNNLDCEDSLIIENNNIDESVDEAWQKFKKEQITAFFASNDYIAARLIQYFCEKKVRIPQEAAVIGFDNIDIASFTFPPLTTVYQEKDEMANKILTLLFRAIKTRKRIRKKIIIKPELVIRSSCGCKI